MLGWQDIQNQPIFLDLFLSMYVPLNIKVIYVCVSVFSVKHQLCP